MGGTGPDVGVTGYTLGGGISWLGRTYGLSANNVQAIEAVTADGRLVRADAYHEPDLFWALRGGGGSFAVVTAIELRLFPITEVYAGLLWWPATSAVPVLHAWRELTHRAVPDEFTTSARMLNWPDGGSFLVVDVVHLGSAAEADALLAPLRALRPVSDTVAVIPARALQHLHMNPEEPVPGVAGGLMLAQLPASAVDEVVRLARPPMLAVELRHVGGEMRRARPGNGALAAIDADWFVFAVGLAPDLPEHHGDPDRPGPLLGSGGVRAAAPRQGRRRPGRRHPVQPPGTPCGPRARPAARRPVLTSATTTAARHPRPGLVRRGAARL